MGSMSSHMKARSLSFSLLTAIPDDLFDIRSEDDGEKCRDGWVQALGG